jgi:L-asparagine transporter-like permease
MEQSTEESPRQILKDIKSEIIGMKAQMTVLTKEINKSGFESNYLAILFSLLGISLPVYLFRQELVSSSLPNILVITALFVFTPFIFISLVLWFLSGKDIRMKQGSMIMFASAICFIILFIISVVLETYFHFLSRYSEYFVPIFVITFFVVGMIVIYKIRKHLIEVYA